MVAPQRSMNAVERLVARFLMSRPGAWFGYYVLPRLDRPLLYLTGGLVSMSPGQPILLLVTVGARSGRRRSTPLLYLLDGDRIIVIASNAGHNHHPAWYFNLRANPEATVLAGGRARRVVAYEASGEERAVLWRRAVDYFAGFAQYEQRVAREIPVMVLVPQHQRLLEVANSSHTRMRRTLNR